MHPFRRYKNLTKGSHHSGQKDPRRDAKSGSSDEEDELPEGRRVSPPKPRRVLHADSGSSETKSSGIPIIRIGSAETDGLTCLSKSPKSPSRVDSAWLAKKQALWTNNPADSDNAKRLGPNTNNIIIESLKTGSK